MAGYGLLGEKLGHSWSVPIHRRLAGYEYRLYEKKPEEVEDFLRSGEYQGLNVTIPYKKKAAAVCDELSPAAAMLGSVNTVLRRQDGTLYGDNTDLFGFGDLVRESGVDPSGKKTLVLGSGGASVTVCAVLRELGAPVTVISRSGEDNYGNLSRHADARLLVNATPVGMYPNNGISPVDLTVFPHLEAVFDLIYNPARTSLMLQARDLGIPAYGGLRMLVAQAVRSCEIFTGREIDREEIRRIRDELSSEMENIVLIGMPGSGKSTVAAILGKATGRPVLEADREIEAVAGKAIPEIFREDGEDAFRALETRVLGDLGSRSGCVISTGGGCVTREENEALLRQNGRIIWLERDLRTLDRRGRPLSLSRDLGDLYEERKPLYRRFADVRIDNNGPPEWAAARILEVLS